MAWPCCAPQIQKQFCLVRCWLMRMIDTISHTKTAGEIVLDEMNLQIEAKQVAANPNSETAVQKPQCRFHQLVQHDKCAPHVNMYSREQE